MGAKTTSETWVKSRGSKIHLVEFESGSGQNAFTLSCAQHAMDWCEHKQTLLTDHPREDWTLLSSLLVDLEYNEVSLGVPYLPSLNYYQFVRIRTLSPDIWSVMAPFRLDSEWSSIGMISIGEGFASLRVMVQAHWSSIVSQYEKQQSALYTDYGFSTFKCQSSGHSFYAQKQQENYLEEQGRAFEIQNKSCILQYGCCVFCNFERQRASADPDLVPE